MANEYHYYSLMRGGEGSPLVEIQYRVYFKSAITSVIDGILVKSTDVPILFIEKLKRGKGGRMEYLPEYSIVSRMTALEWAEYCNKYNKEPDPETVLLRFIR